MKAVIATVLGCIFLMFTPIYFFSTEYDKELENTITVVTERPVKMVDVDPASQKPGFVYFYYIGDEGTIMVNSVNVDYIHSFMLYEGNGEVKVTKLSNRSFDVEVPDTIEGAERVKDMLDYRKNKE